MTDAIKSLFGGPAGARLREVPLVHSSFPLTVSSGLYLAALRLRKQTQKIRTMKRHPVIIIILLLIVIAFGAQAQTATDPAAPAITSTGISLTQIMAVVMAVIVLARLIVKLTPTPADDSFLEKVVAWLKHIGLHIDCLALFAGLMLLAGCATTSLVPVETRVENKAKALTTIVANHVLAAHPEYLPKFNLALASLKVLQGKQIVGVNEVLQIIAILPPDALGKNSGIYVNDAVLFFSDDLETLSVNNPAVAAAAVNGMVGGLERVLPAWQPVPPPSK